MSIVIPICRACAPFNHRIATGDGEILLSAAKIRLRSPQSPLYAHLPPCPIVAARSTDHITDLVRTVPTPSTSNSLESNPRSAIPTLDSSCTARGFLRRGLSDAYPWRLLPPPNRSWNQQLCLLVGW
jgi:hypothetical protein